MAPGAPYDEADTLDLMRADADQVELVAVVADAGPPSEATADESTDFAVPSDAADLGGALHFHLD
jgi:hypothetical protein